MNTKKSTLELFALKSFVSVLPEMKKETALKIVGGGVDGFPLDEPLPQDMTDILDNDCHEAGYGDWNEDDHRCDPPPEDEKPNEKPEDEKPDDGKPEDGFYG